MDEKYNKAEWDFFITALKEEARTILKEVGSSTDPETLVRDALGELEALARRNDGQDNRSEEEIWTQVRERLLKAAYATRPHCIRCGTCCTKGSPTLLEDDMDLFSRSILKPEHLVTIREGEPAYSNQTEELAATPVELIKIRETSGSKTCVFYEKSGSKCTIYESRPAQCRSQECWNTVASAGIDGVSPINRKRLLEPIPALWEIIQRHEERCSYSEFSRAMTRLGATKGQTVGEILDLLAYDHHVRGFIAEHLGIEPDSMDFFLGRPLQDAIANYGLELEEQPDGSFLLKPME
jgi:Fe-S-cluster containining protein